MTPHGAVHGATHNGKTRHRLRRQRSTYPWYAISRCGVVLHRPVPPGWGTACQACERAPARDPDNPVPMQLVSRPPTIQPPYRHEATLANAAGEASVPPPPPVVIRPRHADEPDGAA
jgi:hypothetical protein